MLRFKLRTLLIATALIAVVLGLHLHVDRKTKRFVREVSRASPTGNELLLEFGPIDHLALKDYPVALPLNVWDVVLFRRRVMTKYRELYISEYDGNTWTRPLTNTYYFHPFSQRCEEDRSIKKRKPK